MYFFCCCRLCPWLLPVIPFGGIFFFLTSCIFRDFFSYRQAANLNLTAVKWALFIRILTSRKAHWMITAVFGMLLYIDEVRFCFDTILPQGCYFLTRANVCWLCPFHHTSFWVQEFPPQGQVSPSPHPRAAVHGASNCLCYWGSTDMGQVNIWKTNHWKNNSVHW